MVALVDLTFSSRVEVVDADPGVGDGSCNKAVAEEGVERRGRDLVRELDGDRRVLAKNIKEMHALARSDRQGAAAVRELHRVDRTLQVDLADLRQRAQVPPAHLAVLGCADCHRTTLALVPDNAADDAVGRQAVRIRAEYKRLRVRTVQVKQADLLLVAARKQVLRLHLRVERDSAYNVVMRKGVKRLARVGVPDLAVACQ